VSASWRIIEGDCRDTLASLDAGSVQTACTSPPFWNLRDYGTGDAQLGREPTREAFAAALVGVFREVRRVLADDGTLWLNLGDTWVDRQMQMIPALVALALQADGWWLRMENIWGKRNGLPDGAAHDRPDYFHEQVYLLSKRSYYYFDKDAIREESDPAQEAHNQRYARAYEAHDAKASARMPGAVNNVGIHSRPGKGGRSKRSVWWESVAQFPGAHTATFPVGIVEPCILAGCPEGGTVLDPFAGAGTTGMVALRHGRSFIGCELSPDYVRLARDRIIADAPLLNSHAEEAA
jgi:DNA modification methylase